MRIQDFYAGREFFAQDWLGAHPTEDGVAFRTFAPAAERISCLVNGTPHEMRKVEDGNFWEVEVEGAQVGDAYEFRIWHGGTYVDHCDPYGLQMELRPAHRSLVASPSHQWGDAQWMERRTAGLDGPMNIYEMHAGSWHKRSGDKPSDDPDDWYSYEELADLLVPYLTEAGYNYVEFLPLCEHPFDGSWGYQPTGFFAPTSRYGTPEQLMGLVDRLHQAGIGAILDIVPVHFATDDYGLADYDGTPLFENPNDDVGISEWGSHNFMYSRGESCSFMQSSANFWLSAYHFDGLRMDAISRIIFWQGDEARGVNDQNVAFVRRMNSGVKSLNPGAFTVAEDSTNYPGITSPGESGGLGFDYKWDLGWMHDTLDFFRTPPEERPDQYHKLTFSMMYYYNENYVLPLSHDEVVHGKATIAQKMWGDYELKFPQARALYLYMMVHPGKKLNFMGSEIAQLREWDERREQDWFLRQYPLHDSFWHYCSELNHVYLEHPALWQRDYERDGFQWRKVNGEADVVYAIERWAPGERLVAVFNLSDQAFRGYGIQVPGAHEAKMLIDTDWQRFSGKLPDEVSRATVNPDPSGPWLVADLAPFSGYLVSIS